MMKLGLFEDPYVDPEKAVKVASNPESQKLLMKHTVNQSFFYVMTKNYSNNNGQIKKVKLYVEVSQEIMQQAAQTL